ncbi:unnamed protein product [Didymodactylos carnosus]|uniref:Uncharacterized protein n=1 Tax=Didymodactylos carnosus TaxID=1234261 RepID=A0A814ZZ24_9BILA|nr:unnamed protein product [Didymodactylos carnosus]CAF1249828.1 unnamed protein product [Didymodactylos carnosus]CAF3788139.1 unnamed protein product [Didymodactylos carnosus]CAF4018569.1 unnamed protein product [Didymodactylos carnosus]
MGFPGPSRSVLVSEIRNTINYQKSYLKHLPSNDIEAQLNFGCILKQFTITKIKDYYETFKTIDTRNKTFITRQAFNLLSAPPYSTHVSKIEESLLKIPSSTKNCKLSIEKENQVLDLSKNIHKKINEQDSYEYECTEEEAVNNTDEEEEIVEVYATHEATRKRKQTATARQEKCTIKNFKVASA